MQKRTRNIMWMCRRTAFVFIRLCGVCSANRGMLSIWRRYFKEKYVRNHTDVEVRFATFVFHIVFMSSSMDGTGNQTHSGCQRITSGMLAGSLVWQMLNNQLFGIRSHSPRSRMPCLHSRTDVNTPLGCNLTS